MWIMERKFRLSFSTCRQPSHVLHGAEEAFNNISVGIATRVETQSNPERDEDGDGDGGQEVPGEFVVACVDAPEVLDAAESVFDEMPIPITPFVIDDFALPVDTPRNDRDDAVAAQVCPDSIGVIALVSQQVARALGLVE